MLDTHNTEASKAKHAADVMVALTKQITDLEMQDSLAVSYPNYFAEKWSQNRISLDWTVDDTRMFDPLPECLSEFKLATGAEKQDVQRFWKEIMSTNGKELFPGLDSAFEVGYLGPKVPDIAAFSTGVSAILDQCTLPLLEIVKEKAGRERLMRREDKQCSTLIGFLMHNHCDRTSTVSSTTTTLSYCARHGHDRLDRLLFIGKIKLP